MPKAVSIGARGQRRTRRFVRQLEVIRAIRLEDSPHLNSTNALSMLHGPRGPTRRPSRTPPARLLGAGLRTCPGARVAQGGRSEITPRAHIRT